MSHTPITGYRELSQEELDAINTVKKLESELGDLITEIRGSSFEPDGRWLAIGVTHLQQGFMAVNRAIAKPESRLR